MKLSDLPEQIFLSSDGFIRGHANAWDESFGIGGVNFAPFPYVRADLVEGGEAPKADLPIEGGQIRWAKFIDNDGNFGDWEVVKINNDKIVIDFWGSDMPSSKYMFGPVITPPPEGE